MLNNVFSLVKGSERIEEVHKDCIQKRDFIRHMEYYFDKIRRCHTNLQILREMDSRRDLYITAYKFAPAFWAAVQYDIQMGLIVELNSFLSMSKQDDSLLLYVDEIIKKKEFIFDRKFFVTFRNEAGEEYEEQRIPCHDSLKMLQGCKSTLNSLLNNYPMLKRARSKVYAHIDKTAMDYDECNEKYLQYLNFENITEVINTISDCLIKIYAAFANVVYSADYTNKNDVKNIFGILDIYDKNSKEILKLRRRNV